MGVIPAKSGNDDDSIEKETKSGQGVSAFSGDLARTDIGRVQEDEAEVTRSAATKRVWGTIFGSCYS